LTLSAFQPPFAAFGRRFPTFGSYFELMSNKASVLYNDLASGKYPVNILLPL
jgi:hypothetical protein